MPSTDTGVRRKFRGRNDLNINTSLASSTHRDVVPHMLPPASACNKPPPVSKSSTSKTSKSQSSADSRALRLSSNPSNPSSTPSTHPHESFLDNPTPVEVDMAELPSRAPQRDSHDLSLSPRNVTRDSLVANMLLSLDQLSMGQMTDHKYGAGATSHAYPDAQQFPASEPSRPWTNSSSANGAGRVNGHQYSYSSDLEGGDDSSRMSSQHSRGRRSNSSSNFQSGFSRLNSVREAVNRSQPGSSRGMHSRSGKGSKSSSTNSVDAGYAQVLGSQRWARGFGRSASFDYPTTQQSAEPAPFQVEFTSNFIADEYDAAPNPTVPGGPRREPPIAKPAPKAAVPLPPPAPVEPPTLERKRSTSRSLKSSAGRKVANTREIPPAMPPLDLDSAPAPHVGYEKTKEAVHGGPTPANVAVQPKERPGFFRRVFGSSRNNSHNNNHEPTTSTADHDRSSSNKMPLGSTPPSRDNSSSHSHHPILQKKPSSFFRRRKKSMNEEQPPMPTQEPIPPMPPVAPMDVTSEFERGVLKPQPSPVSSLRKVMNPYLRNNQGPPGTPQGQGPSPLADISNAPHDANSTPDRQEYKREFSPDYEPSPNARIRAVRSDSDDDIPRRTDSPTQMPPERPKAGETRNNSFLNLDGGSDYEEGSPSARRSATKLRTMGLETPSAKDSSQTLKGSKEDTIRAKKSFRLEHTDSEEDFNRSTLALPIEGARANSPASVSTGTDYKSALSAPPTPSVRIEGSTEVSPKVLGTFELMKSKPLDEPDFVIGEPTEDDRQKAQKIFDGNEDFIQKEKAAAWMGEEGPVRQRTLQAYMELYEFTNQSVVYALRQICGRLVFRAETQQVDRILVAFSKRWCDCNPNHGFKVTDVIHTICYSIMLLNTDLHVADIESKMTRSQFIKNTMTTITQAVAESAPDAFDRQSILPEKNSLFTGDNQGQNGETDRRSFRHSFRPPPRTDSGPFEGDDDCGPLVKSRFNGTKKAWEEQIEIVLKGIYASIRDERLPLFGAEPERNLIVPNSQSSLSVMGMLKRTPSVLSKAPSESQLSTRGRINGDGRNNTARWASKSRSRPGMGRNGFSSSRTSFEDGNSLWSPALSSATWSRYSLGRTQTSMSQDSFGSAMPRGDYQQSIGFANALSQAIIRDEDAYGYETGAPSILSADLPANILLEDESLELAGPPWIKEGNVVHKHHLDGVDKKAKDRHWSEVFAVIQKGQMSLFSFNASKSMRQKSRSRNPGNQGPVGGGNWQDNATNVGTFSLRQTLASALPPPGYSRTRPHVWALSLPNGAVHLFQVGTPEIIKEFVTTVNYWSARLSTHPLVGGISNIEYGWSDAIVNNALVAAINETTTSSMAGKISRPSSSAAVGRRSSVASGSFRGSSFDHVAGAFTNNSGRGKLPGDRIHIADWQPPTQSMRPSNSTEDEQLKTLEAYVKGIEEELKTHNQLRSPMLLAFSPRGSNVAKAMSNWEKKSSYLLREIVKFNTYVDCLQQATARKQEIYAERDLAQRAARGELSDSEMEFNSDDEGDETLRP